ncbi:Uncharacterised protein [Mycobacterium tuberculosis]|uniref:Uncharacterized protein n=1 Tax=Mycobacterium tuberculosis TaxID=1773 RepID=A0A916P9T3_MYCTX|nr:Uncharacterised protein [Mycobacterium tuberculosis]CPA61326.1 Uncharacterised protein [Mycobacterium tuberculosis]
MIGIAPHRVEIYERKRCIVVSERLLVTLQSALRIQPHRPVRTLLTSSHLMHAATLLNLANSYSRFSRPHPRIGNQSRRCVRSAVDLAN